MKKLSEIKKIADAKKQASAMRKISIEKKYDAKLDMLNDKKYQIMQVDCINLIELTDNIDRLKLFLSVNFRLADELINQLVSIVSSNSVYGQKNCISDRPSCTYIHRMEV
jgi:hypothetical protein